MTVYVVTQVKITNPEVYARYTSKFMAIFKRYNGSLLVNDESPRVLEGEWDLTKVVLISFPDQDSFTAWATSPEYQEIMQDRLAGGEATILLTQGFDG